MRGRAVLVVVAAVLAACAGAPEPKPVEQLRGWDGQPVESAENGWETDQRVDEPPEQLALTEPPEEPAITGPLSRKTVSVTTLGSWLVDGHTYPAPTAVSSTVVSEVDAEGEYMYEAEFDRALGVCIHTLATGDDVYELRSDSPEESFARLDDDPVDWAEIERRHRESLIATQTDDLVTKSGRDKTGTHERFGLRGSVLAERFGFLFTHQIDPEDSSGSVDFDRSGGELERATLHAEAVWSFGGFREAGSEETLTLREEFEDLPDTYGRIDPTTTIAELEPCGPTQAARAEGWWELIGVVESGDLRIVLDERQDDRQMIRVDAAHGFNVNLGCGSVSGTVTFDSDLRFKASSNLACRESTPDQRSLAAALNQPAELSADGTWLWIGDHLFADQLRTTDFNYERFDRRVDLAWMSYTQLPELEAHGWNFVVEEELPPEEVLGVVKTEAEAVQVLGVDTAFVRLGTDGWQVVVEETIGDCAYYYRSTLYLVGFNGLVAEIYDYRDDDDFCLEDAPLGEPERTTA